MSKEDLRWARHFPGSSPEGAVAAASAACAEATASGDVEVLQGFMFRLKPEHCRNPHSDP